MITRIFHRLLGRESTSSSGKVEPSKQELTSEIKDELVEKPSLPVEDGFRYTRDMGRRHSPEAPQLKAESLEHLWAGNSLHKKVRNDLYRIQSDIREQSRRELDIQNLIEKDQTQADFDRRPGHVVLPERSFEYHGDLATVSYPGSEGKAKKEGSVYSLESNDGFIRLDSETQDYSYLPTITPVVTGTDYSSHTTILQSGEFEIYEDGTVKLPSASDLAEADAIKDQRNLGLQVQKALDWAKTVSSEADYRVDGFESDHDPRPGHTVASNVNEYWFLKKADLPHMKHQTYSVQSGPEGTRLFEDSYGKKPKLLLAVTEDARETKLQMATDEGGKHSLHLAWNKETASVRAEIRRDQSYSPQEARKPESGQIGRASVEYYSPTERPAGRGNRDPLAQDFSQSDRIPSHGGGHHVVVRASGRFPMDQSYPESFQNQDTGKSYRKTSYKKLDGSYLYVENLS